MLMAVTRGEEKIGLEMVRGAREQTGGPIS